MFAILTTYEHTEELNKEDSADLPFESPKQFDDDDDAESSHSDCVIIEPDGSSPIASITSIESPVDLSLIGVLPKSLMRQTNLILVYDNRMLNVCVTNAVPNLDEEHRITILHSNQYYSIPRRHLYLSTACNIERVSIPRQIRVMYRPSAKNNFHLGFVGETPSLFNHLRHLILLDDGTATYTESGDLVHLCLSQDFERTINAIESKCLRENFEQIFLHDSIHQKLFRVNQHIRVKKFDDKYHNAQIVDVDSSLIKVKFYQRQAQTEIWIHQQSAYIDATSQKEPKRKYVELDPISRSPSPSPSLTVSSTDYQCHQCSLQCVFAAEESHNPNYIAQNPYTLPFLCGWTYLHIDRYAEGPFVKKPMTHRSYRRAAHYLYRSPCGRSLLTLDEIQDYLLITNSKLSIKFFIDERATSLTSKFRYDEKYLLHSDISEGKERVRISVFNENHATLPEPFVYATETHCQFSLPDTQSTMTCCSCTDDCRDRTKCECWLKTFEQARLNDDDQIRTWTRQNLSDEQMIARFGYIHQRLKTNVWSGIYECNSRCSCHTKQCTNRLVQNGLYQQLQLFYTEQKGWGLRVLHDVPYGSFINAYVGELITEEMAADRDFKYLAILDHKSHLSTSNANKRKPSATSSHTAQKRSQKAPPIALKNSICPFSEDHCEDDYDEQEEGADEDEDSCFILDAKDYGSISRFYNHSCRPNVNIQNVFIDSHDPRLPVIALFACRNIRAGEEICWDYNYTVGCMPGVRIDCQCQATNCRGRLL